MTKDQLAEESTINLAYAVLKERGEHLTLRQIMDEVRKLNGITVRASAERLPQFNTDINIDGRFLAVDDTRWGLREWYPVDQLEAESAPVVRTRRKKKKQDEDEDEEYEEVAEDGFDIIDEEDEEEEDDATIVTSDDDELEDVELLEEDEDDIPEDIVLDDEDEEEDEEEL